LLRFNTLLTEAGVEPSNVQLVRHQDARSPRGMSPYALWRGRPDAFQRYQSLQSRPVFTSPGLIASFVVPPNGETLFAGLYEVQSVSRNASVERCPLHGTEFPVGEINVYALAPIDTLSALSGLLTIEWGEGARAWVQRAQNQNKAVLELRRRFEEPPFPGFLNFRSKSDALDLLPAAWVTTLSATGGVYLLVSEKTGEQYVGSATGEEGFWARWQSYARDGHGGNVLLRQRSAAPFWISILETAPSSATRNEVIAAEEWWKTKLGSRAFGLNT
jgi:hypothetical protein